MEATFPLPLRQKSNMSAPPQSAATFFVHGKRTIREIDSTTNDIENLSVKTG